jgi:hypothetical protein
VACLRLGEECIVLLTLKKGFFEDIAAHLAQDRVLKGFVFVEHCD